ncbi:phosphoribosyltransferase [Micromonospora sp. WMMD987]|uniref:phosphoribosyltransferase n=1 Tax=Micromonospora sp. WMMD987 TaxID=3016089 RepID=UPI00249C711F|nr:phosphoribosyltransferase [Micromonospora sp. WMMD987]WFE96775.1 phosphoribosyltransferase [Micromonospora sp. WMMD987]
MLADVVVPISYSPRNGQHHHHLRSYKSTPASAQARWNLLALLLLFLRDHLDCVAGGMGGAPTHVIAVPSTRGRPGPHPLQQMVGDRLGLPWLAAVPNPRYGPEARRFQRDWFSVRLPDPAGSARPLVLDDTWTTGSRAQSLAHTLKTAGATTVGVVVLGRHVNPEHAASRPLLTLIEEPVFDLTVCAVER